VSVTVGLSGGGGVVTLAVASPRRVLIDECLYAAVHRDRPGREAPYDRLPSDAQAPTDYPAEDVEDNHRGDEDEDCVECFDEYVLGRVDRRLKGSF